MADNKKNRGIPDSKTVSLKQKYELDYIKKKFNVSGQQVTGAVKAVGKSRGKVYDYLRNLKK
ncbi:MAG: DUF3606 domain-containing protein [Cyclobacteriaceae bacterium]